MRGPRFWPALVLVLSGIATARAQQAPLGGWLSVRKIAEVKRGVLDGLPLPPRGKEPVPVGPERPHGPTSLPKRDTVRLPVTRDTWFSNVGAEADCNTGGSGRLKLRTRRVRPARQPARSSRSSRSRRQDRPAGPPARKAARAYSPT